MVHVCSRIHARWLSRLAATMILVSVSVTLDSAWALPGGLLWAKQYNGPSGFTDQASAVAVSPDGTKVYVTGSSEPSNSNEDYATVAYNSSTGAQLWTKRYNGPAASVDFAEGVVVSPDGARVFVTGHSVGSSDTYDYATVAYDASSGAQLWTKRYDSQGSGDDLAYALAVSADGTKVTVTGQSGDFFDSNYVTVAYNASNGSRLWAKTYNGRNGNDVANAIAASRVGSTVFVTGESMGTTGHPDYVTVAYDGSSGAKLWSKRYGGTSDDVANAVAVSDDRVFVTGHSAYRATATSGFDYGTVAYNASTGAQLWAKVYNGPGSGEDRADAVTVSPDGSQVAVTGHSYGGSTTRDDYATFAYDAMTGGKMWSKRYNGPGSSSDAASAIGMTANEVFVTGFSNGGSTTFDDYATIAYDASSGAQHWAKRHDGPGSGEDHATALAVSTTRSAVFVTGYVDRFVSDEDYATVGYSTT